MVLNIVQGVIIFIISLIVMFIVLQISIFYPYEYLNKRLENIQFKILPFLSIIIIGTILLFSLLDIFHYFFTTINNNFYKPTIYDITYTIMIYLSIYVFTEICRYIEYKTEFKDKNEKYILTYKSDIDIDKGCFDYNNEKVRIEEKDGKEIFKLKLKDYAPTIHGKDKYNDEFVECYLIDMDYYTTSSSVVEIKFKLLNPISYNFNTDFK